MSNFIIVGKTKKKALITVCVNCKGYNIPHFNYISKKLSVSFSLLSAEFIDDPRNIELEDRTDLEEFLNSVVSIESIKKTNKMVYKLNKCFFRELNKIKRKEPGAFETSDEKYRYFPVEIKDIKEDMTNWELIVELWNKYNDEKTPKNLYKPYYRNFQEYIDITVFGTEKELNGGRCFTKLDQGKTPHFIYKLKTGEEFCILFEKPEYLYPIPRKLTQEELDILVNFLSKLNNSKYLPKPETNWQTGLWVWNWQNYNSNFYSPSWFPKYRKLDENLVMPDYKRLNEKEQ